MEYLIKAIKAAGLNPEKEVMISLDVAASEFYKNNLYTMSSEKKQLNSLKMSEYLFNLRKEYPIFSIEDGLAEDDWKGWKELTNMLSKNTIVVGDDLFY